LKEGLWGHNYRQNSKEGGFYRAGVHALVQHWKKTVEEDGNVFSKVVAMCNATVTCVFCKLYEIKHRLYFVTDPPIST
jgi:uncharacterized Fe-S radical SAM superfamily protein PflX